MISNPQQYIDRALKHIDIIQDAYLKMVSSVYVWPETNLYKGDWSAIPLKYNYKNLVDTPINFLIDVCPIAMFSILKPGTEIKKHRGHINYCEYVYRCHVCLQNSENNVLVVENNPYIWKANEGFWFDDSKEHWGWNKGTKERVILMFDIPRDLNCPPSMSEEMIKRFEDLSFK